MAMAIPAAGAIADNIRLYEEAQSAKNILVANQSKSEFLANTESMRSARQ